MPGGKTDPLVSFHFGVEIQGAVVGYFTEVSGIGSEHEIIEHKIMASDGKKEMVKKIPGRLKWENIVCKRGITNSMDMWTWRKQVEDGNVESARKSGTVTMFDEVGAPVAQWTFDRGWPTKVSGPSVKSDGNEVGVEELTIAHEGTRRLK
jgi:phage tail-like protein